MFSKAVIALSLAVSALAQFSVTSPSLVECQPALISWSGSTNSPFTLAVIPGGQPSAAAIEFISDSLTASPYTWTVNLASGTNITLRLTDSTGQIAYGAPTVIQAGASNACLNASASTSGVATGAVTTTNTASTTATGSGAGTSGATTSTTSVAAASSAASSMAASSAAASSAAMTSAAASSAAGTSAAGVVASGASAATSAAAAATSKAASAGFVNAVAGVPAILAGILGFAILA